MGSTHTSVKTYFAVFATLGVMTLLTVFLSSLGLSQGTAVFLAGVIAAFKCSLIAIFFMHLRSESKGIAAFVFTALFFVAVLVMAIIPDIGIIDKMNQ